MLRTFGIAIVWIACCAHLTGCVAYAPVPAYYPPVPAPAPTSAQEFDRAWNAALGALNDAGVRVASADPATGVIRGSKDQTDVLVTVARQANRNLQVEIEARGPQGLDTGLAGRISEAYKRRMGV